MDEQDFKKRADEALAVLCRELNNAGDDYGFEADFSSGALSVELEDPPTKFVISPNTPVRQVWVSAHSKSYKLDWDIVESSFVHAASGRTLKQLIEGALGEHLKVEVNL